MLLGLTAVAAPNVLFAAGLSPKSTMSLKDDPAGASSAAWTGLYVGLHGGYGWGDTSFKDGGTPLGAPPNPPYGAFACGPALTGNYCGVPFELDPGGGFGGLQLGMSWQRERLVYGIEAELGWLGLDETTTLIRPFDDRDVASVDYGWYGTLTGRLGLALDRTLLYVKGGLALADVEVSAADMDLVGAQFQIYAPSLIRHSSLEMGWALGGGLEFALNDHMTLKTEYLYMDFGSETSRSPDGDIYKHENDVHTVKVGVNVRFPGL